MSDVQDHTVCSISFLKKRPDITHEEFYHHWEKIHGPLIKPWMEKHGVLSYTQVRGRPYMLPCTPFPISLAWLNTDYV